MKLSCIEIHFDDLAIIVRKGFVAFVVYLLIGSVVTHIRVDRLEPPRYRRAIEIDLTGGPMVEKPKPDNLISDVRRSGDLRSLSWETEIILREESRAYADVFRAEMDGPLSVLWFDLKTFEGVLRFGVGVTLEGQEDPRVVNLVSNLNLARLQVVANLEQQLSALDREDAAIGLALAELNAARMAQRHPSIADRLHEEKKRVKIRQSQIRERLPALRQPIALPKLKRTGPVVGPNKALLASAVAVLIGALLVGFLTGLVRLIRVRSTTIHRESSGDKGKRTGASKK